MRADVYLVEFGYVESRNRAARLINEGKIEIDGVPVLKPSLQIDDGEHIVTVKEQDKYVGRGGLKLEAAIDAFQIDVKDKRCIDVGASTGGFTDCLLQNGAKSVLAVDSGRDQLHTRLLNDIRVTSLEGYNARELNVDAVGYFDVAVMDVSFISQTLIHRALADVLTENSVFISLIKPQFEAGKSALGKKGIVKSPQDRENAIKKVIESASFCGFELVGLVKSPIEGGDGNREYLACFIKKKGQVTVHLDRLDLKRLCSY